MTSVLAADMQLKLQEDLNSKRRRFQSRRTGTSIIDGEVSVMPEECFHGKETRSLT